MPEGPEVKITTDFLKTYIGKTLTNFGVISGRYSKKGGIDNDIIAKLPATIKNVNCKGKFIYFEISSDQGDYYLFNTLGMTGSWGSKTSDHTRCAFIMNDEEVLYFSDIRNFGTLKFVKDKKDLDKKLNSLGPDIIECDIDWQGFRNRFLGKPNKTIAECIMDQSVICGIGNYLKSEILYASEISPNRLIKDITPNEWHSLYFNSSVISRRSYQYGGATIKDYRKPDGSTGEFSRKFAVYNCKLDPKNNIIIKETTKDGRSTYWVPEIQK